ncbi:hypothetical protein H6788_02180 [Candidatus Nomurabacteria bacterium]|nr:hypothetical protein [Candidatus Nomurabacteria bacterium]MCB9819144.1 hypothetical protein [Candidatus Nomurabacteria bacterium]
MIDIDTYHGIGYSISNRASLVSELSKKLAEQDEQDLRLKELMLKKAPEELREWLNEDGIMRALFIWGRCDTKISYDDEYGFSNLDDVKAKLGVLRKAWRDIVYIKLDKSPEPHRVKVWFSAVL